MLPLILAILLCSAICFGFFFAIFKLICVLLKKSSNRWPLVLAGVATCLLLLVFGILVHRIYSRFIAPIKPIITAATTQKTPLYQQRIYTDEQFGFSVAQYDGMVFSHWINANPLHILIGFDNNILLLPEKDRLANLEVLTILRVPKEQSKATTALEMLNEWVSYTRQNDIPNTQLKWQSEPEEIIIPGASSAAFAKADLYSAEGHLIAPAAVVAAFDPQTIYLLLGIGNKHAEEAVKSLQLPAPVN